MWCPTYISYLLLCNKLPPKPGVFILSKFLQVRNLGMADWVLWLRVSVIQCVILAAVISSLDEGQNCFQAQLQNYRQASDDPLPSSLQRLWAGLLSSLHGDIFTSPQGLHNRTVCFPRANSPSKRE